MNDFMIFRSPHEQKPFRGSRSGHESKPTSLLDTVDAMRQRKLTTIAKRWWRSTLDFNYYDYERVHAILERADLVPVLIKTLVETAPAKGPRYVGTSVLEDLSMDAEFDQRPNRALDHLLAARLTTEENVTVLAGVWPEMLVEWGIREKMAAVLSTEQIDWLTDGGSPGRYDY